MYSLNHIPSFPCESPHGKNLRQSFVDDAAIAAVMSRQEPGWRELRYIGEDFAGRDDYPIPVESAHPWPTRQACGAFFTPAPAVSTAPVLLPTAQEKEQVPIPLWRNSRAVASAAAILLSASLLGLWAIHTASPETNKDQPDQKPEEARMVSQLRE